VTRGQQLPKARQLFQDFLAGFQKLDEDSRCSMEEIQTQKNVLEAYFAATS